MKKINFSLLAIFPFLGIVAVSAQTVESLSGSHHHQDSVVNQQEYSYASESYGGNSLGTCEVTGYYTSKDSSGDVVNIELSLWTESSSTDPKWAYQDFMSVLPNEEMYFSKLCTYGAYDYPRMYNWKNSTSPLYNIDLYYQH